MDALFILLLLLAITVVIALVHYDGQQVGRERGMNEERARQRHPANHGRGHVRVTDNT